MGDRASTEAFADLLKADGHTYAVFRAGVSGRAMRFTSLHETEEQAEAEAVRLLALSVADGVAGRVRIFTVLRVRTSFIHDGTAFLKVDRPGVGR